MIIGSFFSATKAIAGLVKRNRKVRSGVGAWLRQYQPLQTSDGSLP